MTSMILAIFIIIAGITGIFNPRALVDKKNQNLIKKGKPEITEEEMPKHIKKARNFSIFMMVCGALILISDIMLAAM